MAKVTRRTHEIQRHIGYGIGNDRLTEAALVALMGREAKIGVLHFCFSVSFAWFWGTSSMLRSTLEWRRLSRLCTLADL
jgi:hypothetical protein